MHLQRIKQQPTKGLAEPGCNAQPSNSS